MKAIDFLVRNTDDRKEEFELEFENPPLEFIRFMINYKTEPVFIEQIVHFIDKNERMEFGLSIDINNNHYLNREGDEVLSFSSMGEIMNNFEMESIWAEKKLLFIGGTFISQLYVGYGKQNSDHVYIDTNYEDNYIQIARSIFDFFNDLNLIFNPVLNSIELKVEQSKDENNLWLYSDSSKV